MISRGTFHRWLGACLAAVLLCQAALVDASQATLWQDRHQPAPVPLPAIASLSPTAKPSHLPLGRILAPSLGRLQTFHSARAEQRTVIVIQDVHQNEEAQQNISAAVTGLIDNRVADVIGLEGASGAMALAPFRTFPYPDATRAAATYFLHTGRISGPIFAALTSAKALPRFVGLEEAGLYARDVEAVRSASAVRAETEGRLAQQSTELETRKASLSPTLRDLDRTVAAYHAGTVGFGVYLRALSISPSSPNIQRFLEAFDLEKRLSFPTVEKERAGLIDTLARRLPGDATATLAATALAYRAGTVGHAEFYGALEKLAAAQGVSLSAYPAFSAYLRYVFLIDAIEPDALLTEAAVLETSALDALARTEKEREIIDESRGLALTKKLVSFSLTPPEWTAYKQRARRDAALSPFEDFYRAAEARDDAMVASFVTAMNAARAKTGVMVAGGFHAQGIRALLERDDFAVIGFVPRVTKADLSSGSDYLTAFTREKTPLEKLFAGEKLFLAQPPLPVEMDQHFSAAQVAKRLSEKPADEAAMGRWYNDRRDGRGHLENASVRRGEETVDLELEEGGQRLRESFVFSRGALVAATVVVTAPLLTLSLLSWETMWAGLPLALVVIGWAVYLSSRRSAPHEEGPNLLIAAFVNAIDLAGWGKISDKDRQTLERVNTPDGPLWARRAALSTLPATAARVFAEQFADQTRKELGPIDTVEFLYDGSGRLLAILPLPNAAMLEVEGDERLDRQIHLNPFFLSDTYFNPPQPGAVTAGEAKRRWDQHEARALREGLMVDARINRLPLASRYERPVFDPSVGDSARAGEPVRRMPTQAFYLVQVRTEHSGKYIADFRVADAGVFSGKPGPARSTMEAMTTPAGPNEYKFILPVLPTVYNPGRDTVAGADEGYHRKLLDMGSVFNQVMGKPLTYAEDRLFINGVGSGADTITSYLGWMLATQQRPFDPQARLPSLEIWDINPFAVANTLLVARALGIPARAAQPDADAFHHLYIQNRPAFVFGFEPDPDAWTALQHRHDHVGEATLREDAAFYERKLRNGETMLLAWDAEYYDGEGDPDEEATEGRYLTVVQTTFEKGGAILARWRNRQEVEKLPSLLRVVPLDMTPSQTARSFYGTWAMRSLEPASTALTQEFVREHAIEWGYDPDGFFTEAVLAPYYEGRFFQHFDLTFPKKHSNFAPIMWLGMFLIYTGALTGAAAVFYFSGHTPLWLAIPGMLLAFNVGGMMGHSAYNVLARKFEWARLAKEKEAKKEIENLPIRPERALAESLVSFAISYADGNAAGKPLSDLAPPVVNFQTRGGASTSEPLTAGNFPTIYPAVFSREITTAMKGRALPVTTARTVTRLFWMMGLRSTQKMPEGNLLFPDLAALKAALPSVPVDRNPVLYILADSAPDSKQTEEIEKLAAELKRPIEIVKKDGGFRAEGRLNFSAVDAALSQLDAKEIAGLRFVLEGADIETVMAYLREFPDSPALLQLRYVAVESLLQTMTPLNATNLIEMGIAAAALVGKQA